MRLIFQPDRIPRTTTRAEWREIDRWRRVTQRTMREYEEKTREALMADLRDLGAFGRTASRYAAAIEALTNPAVVVYPDLTYP